MSDTPEPVCGDPYPMTQENRKPCIKEPGHPMPHANGRGDFWAPVEEESDVRHA